MLNLVGLTTAAVLYAHAFASLWCVYAALVSGLVLLHMYLRLDDHVKACRIVGVRE